MSGLVIVLIVLMLSQSLLSIVQVKYYQRFIKKITTEQAGTEYEFYTEVVKGRLLRAIVAVVVDAEGRVIQCYVCKGLTIFARFKEDQSYKGTQLVNNRKSIIADLHTKIGSGYLERGGFYNEIYRMGREKLYWYV